MSDLFITLAAIEQPLTKKVPMDSARIPGGTSTIKKALIPAHRRQFRDFPFGSPLLKGLINYWNLQSSGIATLGPAGAVGTNVTSAAGKVGNGAVFNGSTSVINTGIVGPQLNLPRSVSLWFNQTSYANKTLFGYGQPIGGGIFDVILITGGVAAHIYFNSSPGIAYSINTWNHVVLTYNSDGVIVVYLNGTGTPWTVPGGQLVTGNATQIRIGCGSYGPFDFFNGSIDEVGLWNRALTAAEVTALYNGGTGITYPF